MGFKNSPRKQYLQNCCSVSHSLCGNASSMFQISTLMPSTLHDCSMKSESSDNIYCLIFIVISKRGHLCYTEKLRLGGCNVQVSFNSSPPQFTAVTVYLDYGWGLCTYEFSHPHPSCLDHSWGSVCCWGPSSEVVHHSEIEPQAAHPISPGSQAISIYLSCKEVNGMWDR